MTTSPTPTLFALDRDRIHELPWEDFVGGHGVRQKVLYTDAAAVSGLLTFAPGAAELTHMHWEGEHHMWVLRGALVADDTRLESGSYLHVPAHLWHNIAAGNEGCQVFYVFCPT